MKKIYILLFSILSLSESFAQSIYQNPITGTNPNTANPYTTGDVPDPNITVSGIGRGPGINGNNANNRYNARDWSTGATIDLTDYFTFTLTPNAGRSISFVSFVFTLERSTTGPTSLELRSSIDGFTASIGTLANSTGGTLNTIDLSGGSYQNISGAVEFRIYGWNAGGATGTQSVNDFIFNGVTNPLPVTIEYLNGAKQNNSNLLSWKVNCTSSPSATLTVERSSNGRNYLEVNTITADALRCLQPFEYVDNSPVTGNNYYRLKMTDANNKTTYSSSIIIVNKASGFDISGLLPSVVNTSAILNVGAAKKMPMNVVVSDFTGRVVQQQVYNLVAGSNQLKMNFSNLSAGAYQIVGFTSEGASKTIRFIKQ